MVVQRVLDVIRTLTKGAKCGNAGSSRNPVIGLTLSKRLAPVNPFGTRPFLEKLSDALSREGFQVDEITHYNSPARNSSKRWYVLIARKAGKEIRIETPHAIRLLKNAIRVQHKQIDGE